MNALDAIKARIRDLYQTNPAIHINVSITKPKIQLRNEPVIIKGVYPHIFQIEEQSSGLPKMHTLQYADVLMHRIDILELEKDGGAAPGEAPRP